MAADYSKFSINALYKTCSSESLDLVITDPRAPAESVEYLRSAGVDVVIASAGESRRPDSLTCPDFPILAHFVPGCTFRFFSGAK